MQCLWGQWLYIAHAAAWLVSLASRAQENGERVHCYLKPKQPNEWPKVDETNSKKARCSHSESVPRNCLMLWRKFTRRYGWKLGRLARCADVSQRSQLVERLPREKVTARGEKNVNQWYMDNVVKILYYTRRSLQSDYVGVILISKKSWSVQTVFTMERIDIRYA